MKNQGYFRVVAAAPRVHLADCRANVAEIRTMLTYMNKIEPDLVVFPEMCVTGYTCGDLFHQTMLIEDALRAVEELVMMSMHCHSTLVVGLPLRKGSTLYNCALVLAHGSVVAAIPKTYVPNYNEFYEKRWWADAPEDMSTININGREVPFGTRQLIDCGGVKVGVEICEDLWTPVPPSCYAAMAGATVIANLSASDDLTGKYAYLRSLVAQQSARCRCAYVYASSGYGESSTDLVFDGKTIIAENGSIRAEGKRWQHTGSYVVADVDIYALDHDRMHMGSWNDCMRRTPESQAYSVQISEEIREHHDILLYREIDPHPFVPSDTEHLAANCDEILNIQCAGLCRRLEATGSKSLVVGISGGLDSTLALLVAVAAFDKLGLPRKGITGVTMPGFGTTDRTHDNAVALMRQLGVDMREISIVPAVRQHFADIGHNPDVHDITYENSQARERTQLLMDIANQTGGLVLGTGDLSELALGWATYNGDHMSMYGVNAGVPKTLVAHLVSYFAHSVADEATRATLLDIVATPISPELLPPDAEGKITQKTEDTVGPYELHDFFLYYTLRYGFTAERIAMMARKAFKDKYDEATIDKWLATFMRRFFTQQFKRSCLPDGPKVGSVCLSPRGDWRMPSDVKPWLLNYKSKE